MSSITYNNNQLPIQQPTAPPSRYMNQRRRGGVFGGNQSNFWGNQSNVGGNQSNFWGNQSNVGGNQSNFGSNQSNVGGNQSNFRDNQPNFRDNQPNFGDHQQNFGYNQYYYRGNRPNFRNNQFNYRNYQNYQNTNGSFYPRNFYRPNVFYNQNYQQQRYFNRYNNNGYSRINRPLGRFQERQISQNRPGSRSNQQRSRSNQQRQQGSLIRQQRQHLPRQLKLNDFMPIELRERSTSPGTLPTEFNLNAPPDALPQRQIFNTTATTTNNTTQPFVVNQNDQNWQQQQQNRQTTIAPFRRRQRRNQQRQYRQTRGVDNNRFSALADVQDIGPDEIDLTNEEPIQNNNINNNNKKSKKSRLYLEPNRLLKWFEDKFSKNPQKNPLSGRGNQAYLLATAPIYDEWVRNNYELQVWQAYFKMGTEQKHWAKEVVQRTKKRDNIINTRFVQKKINRLTQNITEASAIISDLQIQLTTYWTQVNAEKLVSTIADVTANIVVEKINKTTTTTTSPTTAPSTVNPPIKNQIREPIDRLENYILEYIHTHSQHIKKFAETKVQLAKVQFDEFKALEEFEQIATPAQWNMHLVLKPKIKLWSTKNKNYLTAVKRVEYDLPPKFIEKLDFSFKIDESIINQDEAQTIYNQMRQIIKDCRTQAMTLYVQASARENELLSNEIKRIIEGFPQDNDDGFDAEPGYAAFKHYYNLREKRLNFEAEQSIHFLSEQQVEGNPNDPEQEISAPTLVRSLGKEFLLQQ
ncbi:unnamed protein product [Rotaria sp. Silwood2]|nr:unnamed protein product [Rotaria sp. Silwood2]CAF4469850.1 unnamed protein product [Rotaria sp. Silwood2]